MTVVTWIVAIAAVLVALGTIWTKLLRPTIRFATTAEEMLPLLVELTAQFKDTPQAFSVLDEIARQFRTDSGSSLRDVVNRLEAASNAQASTAIVLETRVKAQTELAAEDRREIAALAVLLGRVLATQHAAADKTEKVADALATAQGVVDQVAVDLADAHERAGMVEEGHPGEAADASAILPPLPPQRGGKQVNEQTDRSVVLAVICFVGMFAIVGLGCMFWLINEGHDASNVALVAGPTGTALGVLGTLLATTGSRPSMPVQQAHAEGYVQAVKEVSDATIGNGGGSGNASSMEVVEAPAIVVSPPDATTDPTGA